MPNPFEIPSIHPRRSNIDEHLNDLRARKHKLQEQVWLWRAVACTFAGLALIGWYGLVMSWTVW